MKADTWRGQQIDYNDTLIYMKAEPGAENPQAEEQPNIGLPYVAIVVGFTDTRICVRRDAMHGREPVYYVAPEEVINLRKRLDAKR